MVFGPNMQNFAEVTRSFLANEGAIQVRDAAELERILAELLADDARRERLGRNALKVVHENLGAILRTVEMILGELKQGQLYIAPEPQPEPADTAEI